MSNGEEKKEFSSIEQILMERERLDKILDKKFRKEVTVMFTDIKGSTQFFETRGDIEGLSMIRKHNEMHFPTIEAYGGKVVKTIGDAIMAVFDDPASGVRAGIEMQNNLKSYNSAQPPSDHIHIRIGMNHGVALTKDDDVFGDAVNLAARIESLADADQILISESVYRAVKDSDDIICRFHTRAQVKGKSEDVKVYRVVWSEEQLVEETQFKKTGTRRVVSLPEERKAVFEINASLEADRLKLSSFERIKGEERTIHHYVDIKVSLEEINRLCREVTSLLNRANKRGRVSKEILKQLQSAGQLLFDAVLNEDAKKKLRQTKAKDLIVRIDDNLVHIPWELLFDGEHFLCQRFSMGRIVSTRQAVSESLSRSVARPLKMLILADPRGDLPMSLEEGKKVRDELDADPDLINANLKAEEVTVEFVKSKLRDFDIVHYAGHADYDAKDPSRSGWLLSDGKFTSADIRAMVGGKPLPALVFSNGCQSGQTEQWQVKDNYEEEIFGLANAFLLAGVQHYIGTFWDILDTPSADFALAFYREMLAGRSTGEAIRLARMELIDKYGEDTIVWASYMLYGDPTFTYFDAAEDAAEVTGAQGAEKSSPVAELSGAPRSASATGAVPKPGGLNFTNISIGILAVVAVALIIAFVWTRFSSQPSVRVPADASDYEKAFALLRNGKAAEAEAAFLKLAQSGGAEAVGAYEGLAAVYWETGKREQAKEKAEQAVNLEPNRIYANIILGRLALEDNNLEQARNHFLAASQGAGPEWQRATAFNELGRIYAAQNNPQEALASYAKASRINPSFAEARANEGVMLAKMGKYGEAQAALEEAAKANPNDAVIAALLRDVIAKQDAAKQEEIRNHINDLIARAESQPNIISRGQDEWTSRPLTITFLDLQSVGLIPGREGENQYLMLKLTQSINADPRLEVVDRSMLDALLNELKLSTSDLVNPATQLKLGRILSARLIATGSIIRDRDSIQVSISVVETETTQIKVALAEIMDRTLSIDEIAQRLSKKLIAEISAKYPLRGEIKSVEGPKVKLNIGSRVGLTEGMKLNLVDPRLSGQERVLGVIQVTAVGEDESEGNVLESKVKVTPGMKFEEQER